MNAPETCHCDQGWICEEHPDRPWPHDECSGPGTQCHNPECSWWQGENPKALDRPWDVVIASTSDSDDDH
jgi:hypothetical protein